MKVLHLTNSYPTKLSPDYGVFTKDQIDNIKELGIESELIFINAREKGKIEYYDAFFKVRKSYKQYDLIHCFHGLTLIIAFFATRKIPILISFLSDIKKENLKSHKTLNKISNQFFFIIYSFIIRSRRVFVIFKNKAPEDYNNGRFYYLPNGVNIKTFRPLDKVESCKILNLDHRNNYILFVTSKDKHRKEKRYDLYKDTIELLKVQYKHYNFQELIMSGIPREKCIYYYNSASLHLLTSDYEGSPNSIKEAMSCNIPIVSTDVGNVRQMIKGATNCFISNQDPEILASYVIKAIESEQCNLRKVLIANDLTAEAKTKELLLLYSKIITSRILVSC